MNIYLTIMVTILVLTQIIHRKNTLIKAQLAQLDDVTQDDFDMQRKAYETGELNELN